MVLHSINIYKYIKRLSLKLGFIKKYHYNISGTASNGVNLSLHRRFHSESEESNYATPAGSLQHI